MQERNSLSSNLFDHSAIPSKDRLILWIGFVLYILLSFYDLSVYVPWRDEADSWMRSRDMTLMELFHDAQYIGHPSLWYLLLKPFSSLELPYITLHYIHFAIAFSMVYVFLFKSPFPTFIKILFMFSYIVSFQYTLVARNYTMGILFLFLIANLFPRRFDRPLTYATLIILLINSHVLNLAIGALFAAEFLLTLFFVKKTFKPTHILALTIVTFAGLFLVFQLYPTAEDIRQSFKENLISVIGVLFLLDSMFEMNKFANVPLFLSFLFALFIFLGIIYKDKRLFLFCAGAIIWPWGIFIFKYGGSHYHHALIFMYVITAFWIFAYSSKTTLSDIDKRNFVRLLGVILAFNCCFSAVQHINLHTSIIFAPKKVAQHILDDYNDHLLVAHSAPLTLSIMPYLREHDPDRQYYQAGEGIMGSYLSFNNAEYQGRLKTQNQIMEETLISLKDHDRNKILYLFTNYYANHKEYGLKQVFYEIGDGIESYWGYKFLTPEEQNSATQ